MSNSQALDEFDQAVLIAFEHNPNISAEIKQQATTFCEQAKLSADGWKSALPKLHECALAKKHDHIKFWCLEIIYHTVLTRYMQLSEEERSQIRTSLFVFVRDVVPKTPLTPFLKGKLSSIFIAIIRYDFPSQWPTFFTDFLSLLPSAHGHGDGSEAIELFLRVMLSLEEDVIQSDSSFGIRGVRSKEDANVAMRIKDAMRDGPLPSLVQALHAIITQYLSQKPQLTTMALEVLAIYTEWIDVELVVNDMFFPLLYQLMQNPVESCRVAAIKLLNGVCNKGMPPQKRIALYQHINIVQVLSEYNFAQDQYDPHLDENLSSSVHVATLLNTITLQLAASLTELTHGYIQAHTHLSTATVRAVKAKVNSLTNLKSSVFSKPPSSPVAPIKQTQQPVLGEYLQSLSEEEQAVVRMLQGALVECLQVVCMTYQSKNYQVNKHITDGLCECLSLLRYPNIVQVDQASFLHALLSSITKQYTLPAWFNYDGQDDEEEVFLTYRGVCLDRIIKNIAQINPNILSTYMLQYVHSGLMAVATKATAVSPDIVIGDCNHTLAGPFSPHPYPTADAVAAMLNVTPSVITTACTFTSTNASLVSSLIACSTINQRDYSISTVPATHVPQLTAAVDAKAVEAMLRIIYVCAETLPIFQVAIFLPSWGPVVATLLCSPIPYISDPAVMEAWFQIVHRLSRVFTVFPGLFPDVVLSFLDQRGLTGSHKILRSKACYYLCKLMKTVDISVKVQVGPVVQRLFESIAPVIDSAFASTGNVARRGLVSEEDAIYLCEIMGNLCSLSITGTSYVVILQQILQIITNPLQTLLNHYQDAFAQDPVLYIKRCTHLIYAASSMIKELAAEDVLKCYQSSTNTPTAGSGAATGSDAQTPNTPILSSNGENVMQVLGHVVELVMSSFAACVSKPVTLGADDDGLTPIDHIRQRTIVFLHSCLETMKEYVMPYLLPALEPLVRTVTPLNVANTVQLLNQIIAKFKIRVLPVLQNLHWLILEQLNNCLNSYNNAQLDNLSANAASAKTPSAAIVETTDINLEAALSEQRQMRDGIRKVYLSYLKDVCLHGLVSVFSSPHHREQLLHTLSTLVMFLSYTHDTAIAKSAAQVLKLFCQHIHKIDLQPNLKMDMFIVNQDSATVNDSNITVATLADGTLSSSLLPSDIFHPFIEKTILPTMLNVLLKPSFNPKDASYAAIIRECVTMMRIYSRVQPARGLQAAGEALAAVGAPTEGIHVLMKMLCAATVEAEKAALCLRDIMLAVRGTAGK